MVPITKLSYIFIEKIEQVVTSTLYNVLNMTFSTSRKHPRVS